MPNFFKHCAKHHPQTGATELRDLRTGNSEIDFSCFSQRSKENRLSENGIYRNKGS
jgi:hypothetical protein